MNDKPKTQHDYILIDRSYSMTPRWADTISGVNAYVDRLAKDEATRDMYVTAAAFDAPTYPDALDFQILARGAGVKFWNPIGEFSLRPRGNTPLLDACMRMVDLMEADKPDRAALVIITDGEENRSRVARKEGVAAALDRCRARGWQVLFLGADFDNFGQAGDLGNAAAQTMSYASHNSVETMSLMAGKRGLYASGAATMDWHEDDRAKAMAPKKPEGRKVK